MPCRDVRIKKYVFLRLLLFGPRNGEKKTRNNTCHFSKQLINLLLIYAIECVLKLWIDFLCKSVCTTTTSNCTYTQFFKAFRLLCILCCFFFFFSRSFFVFFYAFVISIVNIREYIAQTHMYSNSTLSFGACLASGLPSLSVFLIYITVVRIVNIVRALLFTDQQSNTHTYHRRCMVGVCARELTDTRIQAHTHTFHSHERLLHFISAFAHSSSILFIHYI